MTKVYSDELNILAIFNAGMPRTTAEESDSDGSYDSLPELVACSDDEVSKDLFSILHALKSTYVL